MAEINTFFIDIKNFEAVVQFEATLFDFNIFQITYLNRD